MVHLLTLESTIFHTAYRMQMECEIHMGEIDIKKEWPNVRRMQVLGATVVPATEGGRSLKEAVDSACELSFVMCKSKLIVDGGFIHKCMERITCRAHNFIQNSRLFAMHTLIHSYGIHG